MIEFERTKEIILRLLPPAPALVADIGGGPGRYAGWLAGLGYGVEHRDLMPLHVEQVRPRLDGDLRSRLYEKYPHSTPALPGLERRGWMPPLHPGAFTAYCHRPGQLRSEVRAAGLAVADLVNVEGAAFLLADLSERLAVPRDRQAVFDAVRATERVPELLGIGPHLLVSAVRGE